VPDDDLPLTIDELARRTGMTVRNLRAHQSRGLLPPPQVRGRTGYYGEEHVLRVELIKELQADGFNLEAIKRVVADAGGSAGDVLRFTRLVRAPFEEEEPEMVDAAELAERFAVGPDQLRRATELGLLRHLGGMRFEIRSPRLMAVGQQLLELGIPPERILDALGKLRRQADGAAELFVDLFLREVWKPFEEAGWPDEEWPNVAAGVEQLRPLAADSLLATFRMVMTDRVEEAFGREFERALKHRPRDAGRGRRR
jgi:DNA-binding transcriptional MerR regulator